jgi:tRNA(Ile)-lysidine synthase
LSERYPLKGYLFLFLQLKISKMLQEFKKYITENNLLRPGEKILLAVSGGIDSMVMTHLFICSGIQIGIAHCNFSLRSNESDRDEEMVSKFAADNNIEFYTTRFETKSYARENGLSIQMAARELRYSWFEYIRKEHGYNSIAVAHNLNDNIETLLMNLIRGTGITGLTGMKPAANKIIRPLLFATRMEIVSYCEKNRIKYREDRSNADTKYQRNKIRHQIIPLLKEINPSIESTLNETADIFRGINEIVADYITHLRASISEPRTECTAFKTSLLNTYLHNRAILFELFRPFGIAEVTIEDLSHIIRGKTGSRIITGSHIILKNRNELLVSPLPARPDTERIIYNHQDLKLISEIDSVKSVKVTRNFRIPGGPGNACLDEDKLSFPLIVRKWHAGDFFFPLGMKHKKKLSDYFTDNKYSLIDKDNALVLESDGKIVCILGDRIDDRFRITDETKKALIIESVKKGRGGISISIH